MYTSIVFTGGYLTVPTTNTSSRIVSPLIKPSPDSQCLFFSRNLDRNTFLKIYINADKPFNEGYYSSTSTWENTTYILPPIDENYQVFNILTTLYRVSIRII